MVKDREGIIRYKGKLDGKKGTFYGVEVTVGKGKHDGVYHDKKYFDCKKGQGIFVEKKHIIFKINDDDDYQVYSPKKKSNQHHHH